MNLDERETAEGFGLGDETIDRIPCECGQMNCNRFANDYDPIKIDNRYFSDYCASDLVYLRIEEIIEGVAKKTKQLENRCIICGKIGNDVFLCAACNEFVCNDCYEDEIKLLES